MSPSPSLPAVPHVTRVFPRFLCKIDSFPLFLLCLPDDAGTLSLPLDLVYSPETLTVQSSYMDVNFKQLLLISELW